MSTAEANPQTKLEALQALHEQARREKARLEVQLLQASQREAKLAAALEKADERALRQAPPPGARVGESKWRKAVRELNHFDAGELAAEVSVTRREANVKIRDYLARGILKDDGYRTYRFQKPNEGPGEAFEHQQRLRAVPDAPQRAATGAVAVAGTGKTLLSALAKEVRPIVADAMKDGWELRARGDGHFELRKGKAHITVVGTPRNAGNAANQVRRGLAAARG